MRKNNNGNFQFIALLAVVIFIIIFSNISKFDLDFFKTLFLSWRVFVAFIIVVLFVITRWLNGGGNFTLWPLYIFAFYFAIHPELASIFCSEPGLTTNPRAAFGLSVNTINSCKDSIFLSGFTKIVYGIGIVFLGYLIDIKVFKR